MVQLFSPPKLTGRYLKKVLQSGWLTSGPTSAEFKKRLGEYLSVSPSRISLASSATAGFQGIVDLLDARLGHHVYSIADATWPGLHQILSRAIFSHKVVHGEEAKVVVLTSIGGAALIDGARREEEESIWIHDACHSWLREWWADWTFMSLYPTKLVPGAEGGVIVAPTDADAAELDRWLYCGLEPGGAGRGHAPSVSGRKANMTDVQAALNMEALELAPAYIDLIQESWGEYSLLAASRGIPYRAQPYRAYLFQIEVPSEKVLDVMAELAKWGVPSAWNFRPAGLVTLPLYPAMSKTVQSMVLDMVERSLTRCGLRGPTSAPRPRRRK